MLESVRDKWSMPPVVAREVKEVPAEAISPPERVTPLNLPPGFTPHAGRRSVQLPIGEPGLHIAMFGAQASEQKELADHPMHEWAKAHLLNHPNGPSCVQHGRSHQIFGSHTHAICAYWVSKEKFDAWFADPAVHAWWESSERLSGRYGAWREILNVPRNRQESFYHPGFPIGLSRSPEVTLYPTPYNGYYGSMRDRMPIAATDLLEPEEGRGELAVQPGRRGFGEHWRVQVPQNLAVIRGGSCWGLMDGEQLENYEVNLRADVTRGMYYLMVNPIESGCASILWERWLDADGNEMPAEHAHGYFVTYKHLEKWSSGHATHASIFRSAINTYTKFGSNQQYRGWHESYVLAKEGHLFEYLNCHPQTGLLPWFDATRIG